MNKTFNNTFQLNVGPQHPSTHGVLRFIEELDGETIKSLDIKIGYLHRGIEKMAEDMSYLQYVPVVHRVEYLASACCTYAYINAVETLGEISVPKKAQYLRVLLMELNRISSHLLWLACYLLDLGATSPYFYCFRERETVLGILEKLTGARMMYNYYTFGGVKSDISQDLIEKINKFVQDFPSKIQEYQNIITNNPIFLQRTKGIGVITQKQAVSYGLTGVNLRASGIRYDLRKDEPYLVYNELEFDIPCSNDGDSYARYILRIKELEESRKIVAQCTDWLIKNSDDTEIRQNINNRNLSLNSGLAIGRVESARGEILCYLYSDGGKKPSRVKWKTPSFYSLQVLPEIMKGKMYSDLMSVFGSLDVIMPEVDR